MHRNIDTWAENTLPRIKALRPKHADELTALIDAILDKLENKRGDIALHVRISVIPFPAE